MARRIADSVVVITGASSGFGRGAALAFARRGANVVLAARSAGILRELARECEGHGVRALAVPTDVTVEDQVEKLARTAVESFGRIDTWVNNAAVTMFARFEEAPSDDYRRVIETNLFGYLNGARAALKCFREQGSGVLINVGSVVAAAPQPYTSAYVTSKYAVHGFTECLRMELALDEAPDIHVCTVLPASFDTPLFQHAANYTGRAAKALDPVNDPEEVVETIVSLAKRPRRQVLVGKGSASMAAFHRLAPRAYERLMARRIDRNHLQKAPVEALSGNLFGPMPGFASVTGGWRAPKRRWSGRALAFVAGAAALAVAGSAFGWMWARQGRRRRRRSPLALLR